MELGMVSKEGMLIDSTIVKADASIQSLVEVNISPEEYWKRLDQKEKPKKRLAGDFFTGEVDKNKIGKNQPPILMLRFSIDLVQEVTYRTRLTSPQIQMESSLRFLLPQAPFMTLGQYSVLLSPMKKYWVFQTE